MSAAIWWRHCARQGTRCGCYATARRFAALPDGWRLDLAVPEQVSQLPSLRASALVHLAGLIDIRLRPNPAGTELPPLPGDAPHAPLYRANVLTTAALADYCRANAIPIVFASSQTVYGMPDGSPLEESARATSTGALRGEQSCRRSAAVDGCDGGAHRDGIAFSRCLRWQPSQRRCLHNDEGCTADGRIRVVAEFPLPLDVLHVGDVVSGMLAALDPPASGWRCFNLGSGEPCSLTLLAEAIADLVPGCTVEPPRIAQPPVFLSTKAAQVGLSWRASPRSERLLQLINDVRAENVNAA